MEQYFEEQFNLRNAEANAVKEMRLKLITDIATELGKLPDDASKLAGETKINELLRVYPKHFCLVFKRR